MASKKQAIEKYNQGKIRSALNIAKSFKLGVTQEERDVMALGYECEVHPEFYRQIGTDVEKAKSEALVVLKKVLGVVEEESVNLEECADDNRVWLLLMKVKRSTSMVMFILDTDGIQKAIKQKRQEGYAFVLCLNLKKAKRYLKGSMVGMKGVLQNYAATGIKENPKSFIADYVKLANQKLKTGRVEFIIDITAERVAA